VADHRRPRGASDRRLYLLLDGGEAALDDLEQDRIHGRRRGIVGHGVPSACDAAGVTERAMTRFPYGSTVAVKPGCSGTVEPYSSITAGPVMLAPAGRSGRQ